MIKFNEQRNTAVLYTYGMCNLNCRYCTIDKNPVLKDIDDELEKSFEGDYYFERIKEYFPRPDQLETVETWGGEPFLGMHRIHPLIHKLIEYYPYFHSMFSSTNFSYPEWIDQFMSLMDIFAQYPYRQFDYTLQLSVDGPPYINDANRGEGVSQRCIDNFSKLVALIKEDLFPKNVTLIITLKGTWDTDCIEKLDDKEKLIEFFRFYEINYIQPIRTLNKNNIQIECTIPNTAIPSPTSKADGIKFASLVKKCREIEEENRTNHYFLYYTRITPFCAQQQMDCRRYVGQMSCCGSGKSMVGFLPHNMISACHEGFTLLAEQYKEFAAKRSDKNLTVTLNKFFELTPTPMCLTDDQYVNHERKMQYISTDSTVQTSCAVAMIMALAAAGTINQKYVDETQALRAAKFVLLNTAFCIKANYATTGSFCLEPTGLYVLLLNGAIDYLMEEECDECGNNFN